MIYTVKQNCGLKLYDFSNELILTLGKVTSWDNLRVARNRTTQRMSLVQFFEYTKTFILQRHKAGQLIFKFELCLHCIKFDSWHSVDLG